jgi:homoserine kinase
MVRFAASPVRVRTPATSANLGPGFDALGLALALYDEVVAQVAPERVEVTLAGEGADQLARDDSHLVVRSMLAAFDRLGGRPAGLRLHCTNRIPQARGLGSSSAAIVAGILAGRALVDGGAQRLPDSDVLRLASELEGHPDNVAPCLLGGFTIAWLEADGTARAVRSRPADGLRVVLFIPETRGLTADARAALPATVPHRDAAHNAGRAALLMHALTTDPALLLPATEDRLHQDYRAPGMPETAQLMAQLRAAGIPAVVSGAGPTVLAFGDADSVAGIERQQTAPGWRASAVGLDASGARVEVDWQHAERDAVAAGRAI